MAILRAKKFSDDNFKSQSPTQSIETSKNRVIGLGMSEYEF